MNKKRWNKKSLKALCYLIFTYNIHKSSGEIHCEEHAKNLTTHWDLHLYGSGLCQNHSGPLILVYLISLISWSLKNIYFVIAYSVNNVGPVYLWFPSTSWMKLALALQKKSYSKIYTALITLFGTKIILHFWVSKGYLCVWNNKMKCYTKFIQNVQFIQFVINSNQIKFCLSLLTSEHHNYIPKEHHIFFAHLLDFQLPGIWI